MKEDETTLYIDLADAESIARVFVFVTDNRRQGWKYNRYRIVYRIDGHHIFDTGHIFKPNNLYKAIDHLQQCMSNPYDTHEQILLKQLKYERALLFR